MVEGRRADFADDEVGGSLATTGQKPPHH